jgi:class 3 adenylate cyclase/predicted ATPase
MDIASWLRSLGLERYESAFRENEIDETVLRGLTSEDLKDLSVGTVGQRRKLLDAIAALHPNAAPEAPPVEAPENAVERRRVTVIFADLVGFTALSVRMDPEDLQSVIGGYHQCVAKTIHSFDGFVASYLGDGALVYFGYPQAHEDDADRAVRASLALIDAVASLPTPEPLQVRIGVATGLVLVGDLIGSGVANKHGIIGETPNLAARLQTLAEPNTVVISESTRKLLGSLFELRDLGLKDLKGIPGPTHAWSVLRASSVESRFEALRGSVLTALVGRKEELGLLLRRWAKATSGEGQAVLISGEAGVGKSRLTAALLECLAAEPHTCLRYFCSPQHTDSAFYPVIGQFERAAGLAHGDTLQMKLDKLDAMFAQTSTSARDASLFAEMLSLPNSGRYPALNLTSQQRRQSTFEALGAQLETLTRSNPVLMILEDLHWADPTSLEAFGRTLNQIVRLPVLMIATFRPEFESPWINQPHATALMIDRLSEREVGVIIDHIAGDKRLPASLRQDIIERTDGIPLFVEEMTTAVLEAESEGEARRTVAAVPSPALAVPASLYASLMARLDRLGSAKETVQICAVIGREFSHAMLASAVRKPEAELRSALDRLILAGLLFRQGAPPNASYRFKHALVQDAAYGMLVREQKRTFHARIAETLETAQFAEIAESRPELLARHCAEAGLIEKAAGLWGKAGQRSLARSALLEAAEQLNRALALIAALPGTSALRREEIKLRVGSANALMHVKSYSAPETKASFERARMSIERSEALGEPIEDPLVLFSVLYGFWVASVMAFDGDVMRDLAAQFMELAQKQGAKVPLMVGHRLMGTSLLCTGDLAGGRAHYDHAIALYDPAEHRPLATRFGQDVAVAIRSYRSIALWMLGYPVAALGDAERALGDAREIGHAATLMYALSITFFTQALCGRYAAAKTQCDEVSVLAEEKGALIWKAAGTTNLGCVLALTNKAFDAVRVITAGLAAERSIGGTAYRPWWLANCSIAYATLGDFEAAWSSIDEAMTAVEAVKEKWFEADIHRTAGEIARMQADPDLAKAETYFEQALAVARAQRAKSWELRAATSMARLWREQGKRDEAHALLAPIYGWFTEGSDTLDLKEAKALLDELTQLGATS